MALTSIVMKVFERLVKSHICSSIPLLWTLFSLPIIPIDLLMMPSLTYSTPPSNTLTAAMGTLQGCYSTLFPIKLASKLTDLGLNTSLCDWIQDFLTGRVSESRPVHLKLHHPERRSPTGLCPEPPALLSLHT